jgi:hypothetical protein
MSRRVSQSFTLSFAELKFLLPILCETLRFISEPLREIINYFLVSPTWGEVQSKQLQKTLT